MTVAEVATAIDASPIIRFPSGIPGFPGLHEYSLRPIPDLAPFQKLCSLDMEGLEFVVVPPGKIFPDYLVHVGEDDASLVCIESAEQALVLVMVTIPSGPGVPTANLLGPIVVNPEAGLGAQVVQHGTDYGVQSPLPGAK